MAGRDPLAELRQIFRGELEDTLALLEAEAQALGRPDADEATRRRALAEIYRAVHSLKGAAHAVGYPGVQRLCHALETKLAPARGSGAAGSAGMVDAARILADLEVALAVLRESAARLAAAAALDDDALAEAQRWIEAPQRPTTTPAPAPLPELAKRPEPAPARPPEPAPPAERAAPRAPSAQESSAPPPPPVPSSPGLAGLADLTSEPAYRLDETLRVSVARLGDLLTAAEELVSVAGAGRRRALLARHDALAEMLATLRADLGRAHQLARSSRSGAPEPAREEAARMLERALSTTQTITGWAIAAQRQDDLAWRAVSAGASELSLRARALRVVPFETLAPPLERAAAEVARALGREVKLTVRGEAVEIDRRVRDGLREPLLHLVRNAIDHGIEPPEARAAAGKPRAGRVAIEATVAGRDARIVVRDDGQGVDMDKLQTLAAAAGRAAAPDADPREILALLFEPGVTTRREVSAFSGRGVGLDVVRQRVARLHGRVEVESAQGLGTRFTLTVPLDLSVTQGLLVRVRDVRVIFVATTIARLQRAAPADVTTLEGRTYLRDDDGPVPLADLDAALGLSSRPAARLSEEARWPCVVVAAGDRRAAFRVDALLDYHEVLVRPLGGRVQRAALVSGAAVLEDGEVALVLDAADLVRVARPAAGPELADAPDAAPRRRVLVVDDSVTTRQLERAILEAAGYEVTLAHDGQHAWELLATEDPYDAIVSDIEMPRMDGFQLLSRVRATPRTARVPVVLVTALDRTVDKQRALELDASAYVVKRAFDQDALLETLEQLL